MGDCLQAVIEVRSPSDPLKKLQEKMDEYIANGCKLAWLIDPEKQQVHYAEKVVYLPDTFQANDSPQRFTINLSIRNPIRLIVHIGEIRLRSA